MMMALLTKEAPSETLLRRRQILAEISAMQAETRKLDDEATRQRQAVKVAEQTLEAAKLALIAADKQANAHALQSSHRTAPLRRELVETAPPELDELIVRLESDVEHFAGQRQTQTSANAKGLIITSNVPALDRHRAQVYEAVRELNQLKLLAMTDKEIAAAIKRISGSVKEPNTTVSEVKR